VVRADQPEMPVFASDTDDAPPTLPDPPPGRLRLLLLLLP